MATAGDPLAQALLARAYLYGMDGQGRSTKDAAAWAKKSGAKNHPLGLFVQGCCLYFDWTRPTEARENASRPFFDKAAGEGFQKRAEQEGRQWMSMLGDACFFGLGIPKSEAEAVKCWRKAAAAGDTNAMASLGYAYQEGVGVAKDQQMAIEWFQKAAVLGDACGLFAMGACTLQGNGIPKNEPEAVKSLLKAAAAGSPYAMCWLGYCHENGLGVMTDEEAAAKWYRKAADLGDARAKQALEKLLGVAK